MLKADDTVCILRSLEYAEQRRAAVPIHSAADKSGKRDSLPQKVLELDDELNEHDGPNAKDRQEPRNEARSLPIQGLSIHSHSERTKRNKTFAFQKRQV